MILVNHNNPDPVLLLTEKNIGQQQDTFVCFLNASPLFFQVETRQMSSRWRQNYSSWSLWGFESHTQGLCYTGILDPSSFSYKENIIAH